MSDVSYDIFVYGTLRRGGEYHHLYLRYSPCLAEHLRIRDYALYDYAGAYPYMIPEADGVVLGEVYRVDAATKAALDDFEDVDEGLYRFVQLPHYGCYTYLKSDDEVGDMPRVPNGDWITYCSGA